MTEIEVNNVINETNTKVAQKELHSPETNTQTNTEVTNIQNNKPETIIDKKPVK